MTTVQSRFERFTSFAFAASGSFEKGADLWDTLADYEPYVKTGRELNEDFLKKMEELGCSRNWLAYANGEMFAENKHGRMLRSKFMQGIGLSSSKLSFSGHNTLLQSNPFHDEAKPQATQTPDDEISQNRAAKPTRSKKKELK